MVESLRLQPIPLINGTVKLPGSKSISNRVLLLAALASGTTQIDNLLDSDDTRHMLKALTTLGVKYRLSADATQCEIDGLSGLMHTDKGKKLFLGNAGTLLRPLTAILCLGNSEVILTGEPRMKERPIGHLVDALRQGGAQIDYLEQHNYPPLRLKGGFSGGTLTLDGSLSSQFLTALLLAAPLAIQDTDIQIQGNLVSKPYIDITLHLMKIFGVEVRRKNYQHFYIKGRQTYRSPKKYWIEGDASSASYFLAAAAIKGGQVRVKGIGKKSIQGDIEFANVLQRMGATIHWHDDYIECCRGQLQGVDIDMNHTPDVAMTLAITALFARGSTTIRNIYNWRIKETDRIYAMTTELEKVGAKVMAGKDHICIVPPQKLIFTTKINTYNDHRMAMCFSLLALSDNPITILNPNCVTKTFPDYFHNLTALSLCI